MGFLRGCGDLPVTAHWSRTLTGWHTWVQLGDEAFDVVLLEAPAVVYVTPVAEFRAQRGIA